MPEFFAILGGCCKCKDLQGFAIDCQWSPAQFLSCHGAFLFWQLSPSAEKHDFPRVSKGFPWKSANLLPKKWILLQEIEQIPFTFRPGILDFPVEFLTFSSPY